MSRYRKVNLAFQCRVFSSRMNNLLVVFYLGALTFCLPVGVSAQTAPTVIAPITVQTDVNKVNLTTGLMVMDAPELSVPAAPRLKYQRLQDVMPYFAGSASSGTGGISAYLGGYGTAPFTCKEYECVSASMNGDAIIGDMAHSELLQGSTGTEYLFYTKARDRGTSIRAMLYYVSKIVYTDGETITWTYDSAQYPGDTSGDTYYRPTKVSSSTGYYLSFTYQGSSFGTLAWQTVATASLYKDGATPQLLQSLTYSGNSVTDIAGRVFTCDGCNSNLGAVIETPSGQITLPGESTSTINVTANSSYPLIQTLNWDGVVWTYTYTAPTYRADSQQYTFSTLHVSGPNGYARTYGVTTTPHDLNTITSVTDELGRQTQYTYDSYLRPLSIIHPEQDKTTVVYDVYGNITSTTRSAKPGSGLADLTQTAQFNTTNCDVSPQVSCNRVQWIKDGLGRETDFTYNAQGQVTQETDPSDANGIRRATYITYDASNGISLKSVVRTCGIGTTCGTNAEIRTQYTYVGNTALVATETRVDGVTGVSLTTTYTYDTAGRLLEEDGPLAGTADAKYYRYDVLGRKTWEIGPADINGNRVATITTYRDADDKVTAVQTGSVTDPNATSLAVTMDEVDTAYDSRRNPVQVSTTAGGTIYEVTSASFDDRGQPICSTVRMNASAFGSLPADACALGTQGSYGPDRVTKSLFDAGGQLLQVQKAVGTPLQQNYATYTYSQNGKQLSVTDANGNLAALAYDGFDRLAQWTFPSPTTAGQVNAGDYEAYGYDAVGNRTSLRKRDGVTLTYAYDGLNRMTTKSVPASASGAAGYTVSYGYDVRGLETSAVFANGQGITNSYDGFGELTATTSTMSGVSRTLSYAYDAAGNRTQLSWPDATVNYAYDPSGRLTTMTLGPWGIVNRHYDAAGRLAQLDHFNMQVDGWGFPTTYSYDPIGRLSGYQQTYTTSDKNQAVTLAYNPASQIVSRTASNDAFGYGGAVNVSRAYVVNGLNQYTGAGAAAFGYDANGNLTSDGTNGFVYDAENRLVSRSGGGTATLAYDPLGRLFEVDGAGGSVTRFQYDGDRLVAEYDGSGTMLRRHLHGTDPGDDPLATIADGTINKFAYEYQMADERGSIVAFTDAYGQLSPGTWGAINSYDEYGIPGPGNAGRFGYTGQVWLPELGMWYYKARIYSPTLGRFLQTDPVGYKDQVNLYAYVANDPVNRSDPTGLAGQPGGPESERDEENRGLLEEIFDPAAPIRAATLQGLDREIRDINPNYTYLREKGDTSPALIREVRTELRQLATQRAGELERGAASKERNAADHEARAEAFAKSPTVRPGMEGQSPARIANQQQARVGHLRQEAAEFRRQAAADRAEAEKLRTRADELK